MMMKKILLIALALMLSLAFLTACSDGPVVPEQEEVAVEDDMRRMQAQDPNRELEPVAIADFVDAQNGLWETMNTDDLAIVVSYEGTTLTYTYQFFLDGLYEDIGDNSFTSATEEGQLLFDTAKAAVPELTSVIIQLVDGEGAVLRTAEFPQ